MVRTLGWAANTDTTYNDSFSAYGHQKRNTDILPPLAPHQPPAPEQDGKRRRRVVG